MSSLGFSWCFIFAHVNKCLHECLNTHSPLIVLRCCENWNVCLWWFHSQTPKWRNSKTTNGGLCDLAHSYKLKFQKHIASEILCRVNRKSTECHRSIEHYEKQKINGWNMVVKKKSKIARDCEKYGRHFFFKRGGGAITQRLHDNPHWFGPV